MCIEHALRLLSDRTVNIIIYVSIAFSLAQRSWLDSQVKLVQSLYSPFFPPHIGAEPARVQPLYGAGRKESSGTGQKSSISKLVPRVSLLPFLRAEEREGNEVDLYQFA